MGSGEGRIPLSRTLATDLSLLASPSSSLLLIPIYNINIILNKYLIKIRAVLLYVVR